MKALLLTIALLSAISTTQADDSRYSWEYEQPRYDPHNYALDRLEQMNYQYQQQQNYQRQYEQRERQIRQMERENQMFERALNSIGNQR